MKKCYSAVFLFCSVILQPHFLFASDKLEGRIPPGQYLASPISSSNSENLLCEDEELQVQWVNMEGQSTLTIGSKISLPRLGESSFSESSLPDCLLRYVNTNKNKNFEQKVIKTCKDKKFNFTKVSSLKIENNYFTYTYSVTTEKRKKPEISKCKFSRLEGKRGGA